MARILIVDDDKKTAERVGQSLAAAGHTYEIETTGSRVVELAKRERYDLIVLDVMLPGTSGFEVCRQARRDPELYTIPILILSAMNGEEEVLHGLAQGADDYVVKPFDIRNLIQRIEALLRTSLDTEHLDKATELPTADITKREIQKRISLGDVFALGYAELVNVREFSYHCGSEARMKAIRHLARALDQCGVEMRLDSFFVGHMGGGHFVCLLPPAKTASYCKFVRKVWESHLEPFYTSIGHGKLYNDASAAEREGAPCPAPLLDVWFCATIRDRRDTNTPQQMFETLAQIRAKSATSRRGGCYIDQRS